MKKQLSLLCLAFIASIVMVYAQGRETRSVGTFTKISFRTPGKLYLRQGSTQKVELEGKKDIISQIETRVDGDKLVIGKEGKWFDWGNDDEIKVYITIKDLEGLSLSGSGDVIGETAFTTGNIDLNVSGSGSMKLEVQASGDIEANVSGSGSINLKGKCRSIESDVSGSGDVVADLSIAERADFGVSGSGAIKASGSAESAKATISGSGKVLAANLEVKRCDVRIGGSGDVEINVKDELDADISGSGTVTYKGSPSKVNSHASGSGKVSKF